MRTAQWRPGWYELDQSIEIGLVAELAFFPPGADCSSGGELVFFNTLWNPDEAVAARGVIAAISHPRLGSIRKVETAGLDYTFTLEDGRELVVNAEEEPGTVYELVDGTWRAADQQIGDWTLRVELRDLGPLGPAPARLDD